MNFSTNPNCFLIVLSMLTRKLRSSRPVWKILIRTSKPSQLTSTRALSTTTVTQQNSKAKSRTFSTWRLSTQQQNKSTESTRQLLHQAANTFKKYFTSSPRQTNSTSLSLTIKQLKKASQIMKIKCRKSSTIFITTRTSKLLPMKSTRRTILLSILKLCRWDVTRCLASWLTMRLNTWLQKKTLLISIKTQLNSKTNNWRSSVTTSSSGNSRKWKKTTS